MGSSADEIEQKQRLVVSGKQIGKQTQEKNREEKKITKNMY